MPKKPRKNTSVGLFGAYQSLLGISELACRRCMEKHTRADSICAVVFAVIGLEAFINELAALATLFDTDDNPRIRSFGALVTRMETDKERLQTKYSIGHFALTGELYPRGAQPYQDFALLVNLRNEIVHYKAQKGTHNRYTFEVIYDPSKLVKKLANKKLISKPSTNSDMATLTRLGTTKVAIWSYNTAVEMVKAMHQAIPAGPFREMQLATTRVRPIDPASNI